MTIDVTVKFPVNLDQFLGNDGEAMNITVMPEDAIEIATCKESKTFVGVINDEASKNYPNLRYGTLIEFTKEADKDPIVHCDALKVMNDLKGLSKEQLGEFVEQLEDDYVSETVSDFARNRAPIAEAVCDEIEVQLGGFVNAVSNEQER